MVIRVTLTWSPFNYSSVWPLPVQCSGEKALLHSNPPLISSVSVLSVCFERDCRSFRVNVVIHHLLFGSDCSLWLNRGRGDTEWCIEGPLLESLYLIYNNFFSLFLSSQNFYSFICENMYYICIYWYIMRLKINK